MLPDHYTIPLVPGDFNQIERPRGMLFVTVVSSVNVPKMDWFNGSDPYVRYALLAPVVLYCKYCNNLQQQMCNCLQSHLIMTTIGMKRSSGTVAEGEVSARAPQVLESLFCLFVGILFEDVCS